MDQLNKPAFKDYVLLFICIGIGWLAGCGSAGSGSVDSDSAVEDTQSQSQAETASSEDSLSEDSEGSTATDTGSGSATATADTDTGVASDTLVDTDTSVPACVLYVSADSAGGNGLSWELALPSVQDGIDAAAAMVAAGADFCEVWVEAGVYYIFETSMNDTVQLRSKVHVYGGFSGDELLRGERDVLAHPTVLDGHRHAADFGSRVLHVLRGASDAVLDGFVVTGGYSAVSYDPADHDNYGAGMLCEQVSPTVRNTWFVENEAMWDGAVAVFGKSAPRFESCVWSDNLTGGLFALNSSPIVERCVFAGNRISGLVANGKTAKPIVTSSVFAGNRDFGVESWYKAVVSLEHCTIAGNFASIDSPDYGGGLYAVGGTIELRSSVVHGNIPAVMKQEEGGLVTATFSAIAGLEGEGNLDVDPALSGFPLTQSGAWAQVEYDAAQDVTRLRDEAAEFSAANVSGLFVVPNADPALAGGPVWVPVAISAASWLTVVGDVSWLATPGDLYALYDLTLQSSSPCVGAADPQGTAPVDVAGTLRDDQPDMGAYERVNP